MADDCLHTPAWTEGTFFKAEAGLPFYSVILDMLSNFFKMRGAPAAFFRSQEFNQLFIVFRIFKCFSGELFLSELKSLLLLLFFHLLKTDILKDWVDDWLGSLWRGNFALSHSHNSLNNDVVAVNTDVLEQRVGNERVSWEILEEINLLSLTSFFEIKVDLIWLTSQVQLINILLERLHKELLGFLAHDVDLAGDPLVHLLLPLSGVFALEFLGNLADLWFCSNLVMWLIYFLLSILSRIS